MLATRRSRRFPQGFTSPCHARPARLGEEVAPETPCTHTHALQLSAPRLSAFIEPLPVSVVPFAVTSSTICAPPSPPSASFQPQRHGQLTRRLGDPLPPSAVPASAPAYNSHPHHTFYPLPPQASTRTTGRLEPAREQHLHLLPPPLTHRCDPSMHHYNHQSTSS